VIRFTVAFCAASRTDTLTCAVTRRPSRSGCESAARVPLVRIRWKVRFWPSWLSQVSDGSEVSVRARHLDARGDPHLGVLGGLDRHVQRPPGQDMLDPGGVDVDDRGDIWSCDHCDIEPRPACLVAVRAIAY
jgi:hypothetical protein